MIAVLQRVNNATVYADGVLSGEIGYGLYILLGVEKDDTELDAELLSEKISKLRIFSDENGKMNLSLKDIDGEALVVSNFTLYANYAHGNRPDYLNGAAPDMANSLYEFFKKDQPFLDFSAPLHYTVKGCQNRQKRRVFYEHFPCTS